MKHLLLEIHKIFFFPEWSRPLRLIVLFILWVLAITTSLPFDIIQDPISDISATTIFSFLRENSRIVIFIAFLFCVLYSVALILWMLLGTFKSPLSEFFARLLEIFSQYWLLLISVYLLLSNICEGHWIYNFYLYIVNLPSFIRVFLLFSMIIGVIVDIASYVIWYKRP